MSIFSKFFREGRAEREYFKQRKAEEADGGLPAYLRVSERRITKDLLVDLMRVMKSHDTRGTVAILSNSIDNVSKETGIMLNKGIMPQKIIAYLQDIRLANINAAIELFKKSKPNFEGCYFFESPVAAKLNLPAGVVVYPIFGVKRPDLVMMMVFKKSVENKKELIKQLNKTIKADQK